MKFASFVVVALSVVSIVASKDAATTAAAGKKPAVLTEFYALRHSTAMPNELIKVTVSRMDQFPFYSHSVASIGKIAWDDLAPGTASKEKMYLLTPSESSSSASGHRLVTEMPFQSAAGKYALPNSSVKI
jgi:hypothetical protein